MSVQRYIDLLHTHTIMRRKKDKKYFVVYVKPLFQFAFLLRYPYFLLHRLRNISKTLKTN